MATEKTIIRDTKSESGIVGLTRKEPALVRWTLTRHILADYAPTMKECSGFQSSAVKRHAQSKPAEMKRDERDVLAIINHVQGNITYCIVNISTGRHASPEVQRDQARASTAKFTNRA